MDPVLIVEFQKRVYEFHRRHRRDLPWRRTHDPYHILVSEIMLQQTQVERVAAKFESFITKFPDFNSLDMASLEDVLKEWQGLGYNRRALALKVIAHKVMGEFEGSLPRDEETLQGFQGIGKGTSASIMAFAFNLPSVVIETNIRRVYIHCFFPDAKQVSDREIHPFVEASCDWQNPREWYYALMDYGWYLGRMIENPNRRSVKYRKQPMFVGSDRQLRGLIIREILRQGNLSREALVNRVIQDHEFPADKICALLEKLEYEGFIHQVDGNLKIR